MHTQKSLLQRKQLLCNLMGKEFWTQISCITSNKLAIVILVYCKLIYVLSGTCLLGGEMCDRLWYTRCSTVEMDR